MKHIRMVGLVVTAVVVSSAHTGQPGDLDHSFGRDGVRYIDTAAR